MAVYYWLIDRCPGSYGWFVAVVSILGIALTAPAQAGCLGASFSQIVEDLDVPRITLTLVFTISTLLAAVVLPALGKCIDYHGPRCSFLILTCCLGMTCFVYANLQQNVIWLAFSFFGLRVFGQGGLFLAAMNVVNTWYVERRSTIMRVIHCCFAFSITGISGNVGYMLSTPDSSVYGRLSSSKSSPGFLSHSSAAVEDSLGVKNYPNNYLEEQVEQNSWRKTYEILGMLHWFVLLPISFLFLPDRPEKYGVLPDGCGFSRDGKLLADILRQGRRRRRAGTCVSTYSRKLGSFGRKIKDLSSPIGRTLRRKFPKSFSKSISGRKGNSRGSNELFADPSASMTADLPSHLACISADFDSKRCSDDSLTELHRLAGLPPVVKKRNYESYYERLAHGMHLQSGKVRKPRNTVGRFQQNFLCIEDGESTTTPIPMKNDNWVGSNDRFRDLHAEQPSCVVGHPNLNILQAIADGENPMHDATGRSRLGGIENPVETGSKKENVIGGIVIKRPGFLSSANQKQFKSKVSQVFKRLRKVPAKSEYKDLYEADVEIDDSNGNTENRKPKKLKARPSDTGHAAGAGADKVKICVNDMESLHSGDFFKSRDNFDDGDDGNSFHDAKSDFQSINSKESVDAKNSKERTVPFGPDGKSSKTPSKTPKHGCSKGGSKHHGSPDTSDKHPCQIENRSKTYLEDLLKNKFVFHKNWVDKKILNLNVDKITHSSIKRTFMKSTNRAWKDPSELTESQYGQFNKPEDLQDLTNDNTPVTNGNKAKSTSAETDLVTGDHGGSGVANGSAHGDRSLISEKSTPDTSDVEQHTSFQERLTFVKTPSCCTLTGEVPTVDLMRGFDHRVSSMYSSFSEYCEDPLANMIGNTTSLSTKNALGNSGIDWKSDFRLEQDDRIEEPCISLSEALSRADFWIFTLSNSIVCGITATMLLHLDSIFYPFRDHLSWFYIPSAIAGSCTVLFATRFVENREIAQSELRIVLRQILAEILVCGFTVLLLLIYFATNHGRSLGAIGYVDALGKTSNGNSNLAIRTTDGNGIPNGNDIANTYLSREQHHHIPNHDVVPTGDFLSLVLLMVVGVCLGCGNGFTMVIQSNAFANTFGRAHIFRIQSVAKTIMVLHSAIMPLVFVLLHSYFERNYIHVFFTTVFYPVLVSILTWRTIKKGKER